MSLLNKLPDSISNPLVSVVLIVRNGDRYLAQALESVTAQDYRPLEILVIDGKSTDNTAQIATQFPLVRCIEQTDIGIANAYNRGIDEAKGKFIAFISHDDLWTLNKLTLQIGYMINHPEVQYTIGNTQFFLETGYDYPLILRPGYLEGTHLIKIMRVLIARKSLFKKIGKLNPDITYANDTEWYMRAQDLNTPMAIIPETILHKRIHAQSTTLSHRETVKQELWSILRQSIHRKHDPCSNDKADRLLCKEVQP